MSIRRMRPRLLAVIATCMATALGGCSEAPQSPTPQPAARVAQREKAAPPPRDAQKPTSDEQTGSPDKPLTLDSTLPSEGERDDKPGPLPQPIALDPLRVTDAGLRRIEAPRLALFTDVPASPEIEALPALFDQAYEQWCQYFGHPNWVSLPWQMHGFLVQDKSHFERAGAWPADLYPFRNGYAMGMDLWLYEQPSDYYRRHLLLHEGTHAFMYTRLGSVGPPWYAEGMAELLATHRLDAGQLKLDVFPARREDVPQLGRIKLVRQDVAGGRTFTIDQILHFGPEAHQQNEGYAWCWALAALLDGHPAYRERFRQLPAALRQEDFNGHFRRLFAADWGELGDTWQTFVGDLEHGFDFNRWAIDFRRGEPLPSGGRQVKVAADRGWQSSGIRLEAGHSYRLKAAGRYEIARHEGRVWWCEPGGVTIRYYAGRPLGMLLAAVRPDEHQPGGRCAFLSPEPVGLAATITPKHSGTLYLRVNDSAGELSDNAGELTVDCGAGFQPAAK